MNITSIIANEGNTMGPLPNILRDTLGFKDYKRVVTLFLKETKNIHGIKDNNLVTKINGMITNYSIVDDKNHKCRIYTKTVYVCEVEFPANITLDMLKRNIEGFISRATINPMHAFTNMHLVSEKDFLDFGLTMVDLTVSDKNRLHIVNYSSSDVDFETNEFYKYLVYNNKYNPRYYNVFDQDALMGFGCNERSGAIQEFYDTRTKLVCNTHGDESVDNFINNDRKTGIYINKQTVNVSESISEMFNKHLFMNIEEIVFVYNSVHDDLNIKKMSMFAKYRDDLENHIINGVYKSIVSWKNKLRNELLSGHDFHLVMSLDTQFAIIDIMFLKENKEIRITRPLYKLYGEFSLNSELLLNDVETTKEMMMIDYIDQSLQTVGNSSMSENELENLEEALNVIQNTTKTLELLIADRKDEFKRLIGSDIKECLEKE